MKAAASLSRRAVLRSFAVGSAVTALPGFAHALTETEASDLIQTVIAELYKATEDGRPQAQVFMDVEAILRRYSEIGVIARSALGVAWRSATDPQKLGFVNAFATYLSRKYGRRFRDFAIANVKVTSTRKVTSGFMVSSTVTMKGGTWYGIEWQVVNLAGAEKLVNLSIEGISMLASERSEIARLLDARRGNLDQLIADLANLG